MLKAGDYCSQSPYLTVTSLTQVQPRCPWLFHGVISTANVGLFQMSGTTLNRERTVLRKHQLDAKNSPGRSHMRGSVGVLAWQNYHLHMRHDWKFFFLIFGKQGYVR
jgi:hypothetical protein